MTQLIVVLVAMLCIPILLRFKLSVGLTLIILGVAIGIVGGIPVKLVWGSFADVFLKWPIFSSVLIVIEIGMLGALMKQYGILKRMEDALRKLVPSDRAIIMLLPAMIGALQAPGGAALSAPFVDNLGTEMGLTRAERSNINVVCRHILLLLVPYSANLVIAHNLAPTMSIPHLALMNLGFVILMQAAGYFFILRKSKHTEIVKVNGKEWLKALVEFTYTFFPVYLIVALKTIFNMNYAIAILFSMAAVFFMGDKKDFIKNFIESINKQVALMIIGVFFFQNIVGNLSNMMEFFKNLFTGQSQWMFLGLIALVGTVFGLATGLMYLSMGVLIPIAMSLPWASETAKEIAFFYTVCWCFVGYLFSPIHLCQLLSDQVIGCTVKERYQNYIPMLIALPIILIFLYFVYNLILA
jgi:integral membrane protein (TIGR00529 family)